MARATFTRQVGISGPNASRDEKIRIEFALADELYATARADGYDLDISIKIDAHMGTAIITVTGEDADAFARDNH